MDAKHRAAIGKGARWGALCGLVSVVALGVYVFIGARNAPADHLRAEWADVAGFGALLLGYPISLVGEALYSTVFWWLAYPILFVSPIVNMTFAGALVGWGTSALNRLVRSE